MKMSVYVEGDRSNEFVSGNASRYWTLKQDAKAQYYRRSMSTIIQDSEKIGHCRAGITPRWKIGGCDRNGDEQS